jgi:hypothetical protein
MDDRSARDGGQVPIWDRKLRETKVGDGIDEATSSPVRIIAVRCAVHTQEFREQRTRRKRECGRPE